MAVSVHTHSCACSPVPLCLSKWEMPSISCSHVDKTIPFRMIFYLKSEERPQLSRMKDMKGHACTCARASSEPEF